MTSVKCQLNVQVTLLIFDLDSSDESELDMAPSCLYVSKFLETVYRFIFINWPKFIKGWVKLSKKFQKIPKNSKKLCRFHFVLVYWFPGSSRWKLWTVSFSVIKAQVQLALGSMIDVHGSGTAQDQQGSTHY